MVDTDVYSDNWIGKTVFIITNGGRKYKGKVINQNYLSLTIIDIKNYQVLLNFSEIKVLQEEE